MAKVKGYNPPETEFAYDDATGDRHYFGEFLRMVLGEGSISPRDPETDIIGKTRRGERPSQQGEGTDTQAFYRDIFKNCTKMWNTLPEECPGLPPDPQPTAKESIWEAKLEHGVVCSYYDLWMRCCIKHALSQGGAMPDGDCFPCLDVCSCIDIEIGYTTQQMSTDEEQALEVINAIEGCVYDWEITSGGGSLSANQGTNISYTAPSTNAECVENPVISLSVEGNVCDTLAIAINAVAGAAYYINECISESFSFPSYLKLNCRTATVRTDEYNCDDTFNAIIGFCPFESKSCTEPCSLDDCIAQLTLPYEMTCAERSLLCDPNSYALNEPDDKRTPEQKTAGCCPAALL